METTTRTQEGTRTVVAMVRKPNPRRARFLDLLPAKLQRMELYMPTGREREREREREQGVSGFYRKSRVRGSHTREERLRQLKREIMSATNK
jgi:hypothetical protein